MLRLFGADCTRKIIWHFADPVFNLSRFVCAARPRAVALPWLDLIPQFINPKPRRSHVEQNQKSL